MPEPNEQSPEVEVITLRKVRDELLAKTHTQKAKIAELESQALQLTEKADRATELMRTVVVDVPLNHMVSKLSKNVPELVMRELHEDFTFDAADEGSIEVKSRVDGKVIAAKDGKPVTWDKHSLHQFLIGHGYAEQTPRQRVYTHLLGIPVGSGGIGRKLPMPVAQKENASNENSLSALSFGLR